MNGADEYFEQVLSDLDEIRHADLDAPERFLKLLTAIAMRVGRIDHELTMAGNQLPGEFSLNSISIVAHAIRLGRLEAATIDELEDDL